jgi:hypothetical protein
MLPIWDCLPEDVRGEILDPRKPQVHRLPADDVIMVGGAIDLDGQQRQRYIYVEHGAGQTYEGLNDHTRMYYPGGHHPENVVGYVAPSQRVADLWGRPAIAVGCPALDKLWAPGWNWKRAAAITFHFDGIRICPEARSARPHWFDELHSIVGWLRGYGLEVIGHRHPRDRDAPEIWQRLGVEFVDDPDEVLERCSILVADNTSLLYEAAALGKHTFVLNAPWYRKDVHHGMRFWDHVPGPQFDDIFELQKAEPCSAHTNDRDKLQAVADYAYALRPGANGGKVAAEWILELVG